MEAMWICYERDRCDRQGYAGTCEHDPTPEAATPSTGFVAPARAGIRGTPLVTISRHTSRTLQQSPFEHLVT
ncbi:MAG: hypothetical protein JWO42_3841 [Chloroflexi bacterium]|jgi:hypothetical protein|nr:hypothetical protein [Chloroflexota bacterium]